jgi:hypothetical protein
MGKYYSKVIIEAVQYLNYNADEVIQFTGGKAEKQKIYSSLKMGEKLIGIGDYVVNDNGVLTVLHPHHFESKYKPI